MQKWLIIIGGVGILAFLGYFGYLEWRVRDLKAEKVTLEASLAQSLADVAARDAQIVLLGQREAKLKEIEATYAKANQELPKLPTGPVAPVLRYAIGVQ